jgi:hypothetical protein
MTFFFSSFLGWDVIFGQKVSNLETQNGGLYRGRE